MGKRRNYGKERSEAGETDSYLNKREEQKKGEKEEGKRRGK